MQKPHFYGDDEKLEKLRVATLNIWNKSGPWAERLPLLRKQLSELSPDVVGLQEVLRLVPRAGRGFLVGIAWSAHWPGG